jgi:hypothetical protein
MPLPRVGALVLLFLIAVDTHQDPATGGRRLGTGDADVARNYLATTSNDYMYQCVHENDSAHDYILLCRKCSCGALGACVKT